MYMVEIFAIVLAVQWIKNDDKNRLERSCTKDICAENGRTDNQATH